MTGKWETRSTDYNALSNGIIFASNEDFYYALGYANWVSGTSNAYPMIACVRTLTGAVEWVYHHTGTKGGYQAMSMIKDGTNDYLFVATGDATQVKTIGRLIINSSTFAAPSNGDTFQESGSLITGNR